MKYCGGLPARWPHVEVKKSPRGEGKGNHHGGQDGRFRMIRTGAGRYFRRKRHRCDGEPLGQTRDARLAPFPVCSTLAGAQTRRDGHRAELQGLPIRIGVFPIDGAGAGEAVKVTGQLDVLHDVRPLFYSRSVQAQEQAQQQGAQRQGHPQGLEAAQFGVEIRLAGFGGCHDRFLTWCA